MDSADEFADYEVKPQLKTLGPKYGKLLGKIREALQNLGAKARDLVNDVKNGGKHKFNLGNEVVEVEESDLLISSKNKDGYSVVSDHGDTVALDVTLDEGLVEEGLVREIVSRVQTMRKECGFSVSDHIKIGYKADGELAKVFQNYAQTIADGTLADSVSPSNEGAFSKELEIGSDKFTLYLTVVSK